MILRMLCNLNYYKFSNSSIFKIRKNEIQKNKDSKEQIGLLTKTTCCNDIWKSTQYQGVLEINFLLIKLKK